MTLRELVTTTPAGHYQYFAYFYKCGDMFTPSFYKQQAQIVWNGLTRQNASGEAGVVAIFCEAVARGKAPTIHGDGQQTRDFVYVGDVAVANAAAATSDAIGVFNVGTGMEIDVNELFEAIARELRAGITASHGPAREGDISRSVLDPSRAAHVLGWRADVDLARGLQETVRWFLSHAAAD